MSNQTAIEQLGRMQERYLAALEEINQLEVDKETMLDLLEEIVFPRRGSEAERWTIADISAHAANLLKQHRFEPAEQPLPDECQDTLSFVGGCVCPPNTCKKCFTENKEK